MFALLLRDQDVIAVRGVGGSGHSPVAMCAATAASMSFTCAARARSSVRSRRAQSRQATANMPGPTVSSHRGPSARVPGSSRIAGSIAAAASTSSGEGNAGVHSPATESGTDVSSRSSGSVSVRSLGPRPDMAHRTSPGGRPSAGAGAAAGSVATGLRRSLLSSTRCGVPATPAPAAHDDSEESGRRRVRAPRIRQGGQRPPRRTSRRRARRGRAGPACSRWGSGTRRGLSGRPSRGACDRMRTRGIATGPVGVCGGRVRRAVSRPWRSERRDGGGRDQRAGAARAFGDQALRPGPGHRPQERGPRVSSGSGVRWWSGRGLSLVGASGV